MAEVEIFFLGLLGLASCASIAADNVALVALSFFFLFRLVTGRWRPSPPAILLVVFFAWNAVSALASPLRSEALKSIPNYWAWSALLTASAIPASRRKLDQFAALMSVSAIASAVVAMLEFFTGADWPQKMPFGDAPDGAIPANAFFSTHLTYGGVIAIAGFFLAGRAIYGDDKKAIKVLLWVATAACGFGLVASEARTYWVAAVFAMAVLLCGKGWKRIAAASGILLVAGTLALAIGPAALRGRALSTFDLSNASSAERICLWISGLKMVEERPIFGWGVGTYQEASPPYKAPYAGRIHQPDGSTGFQTTCHAHNQYLMVAIHSGLVGLGLFLAFVVLAFRAAWRNPDAGIKYGTAAALAVFLIGGFFEYNGGDAEVATLIFFLLGLAMPATPLSRDSTKTVAASGGEQTAKSAGL
ncbi:MAG: O-antigen ligase family protein [Acidobacteria bacterium]|nr:O-antigen ligase family protein [Acidobacteriota bacterium]